MDEEKGRVRYRGREAGRTREGRMKRKGKKEKREEQGCMGKGRGEKGVGE